MICQDGLTEMVALLLADPRIDINRPINRGATPLFIASQNGYKDVVSLLLADPRIDVNRAESSGVTPFFMACQSGHKEMVSQLLAHPGIEVNKADRPVYTAFFMACQNGNDDVVSLSGRQEGRCEQATKGGSYSFFGCSSGHKVVVSLLLADPRIDVTKGNINNASPFLIATQLGHHEIVSLLLDDPRIDINQRKNDGCTPLWFAAQFGFVKVVQLILASGREVDTKSKSYQGPNQYCDMTAADVGRYQTARDGRDVSAEEHARRWKNGPLIAELLDSFDADPVATRQHVRELPRYRDSFISDLFALVIFLCDGLLMVSPESSTTSTSAVSTTIMATTASVTFTSSTIVIVTTTTTTTTTTIKEGTRFFLIAQRLPLELQMMLCNRAFRSERDIVLKKHSEVAFKKLGKLLARTESQ